MSQIYWSGVILQLTVSTSGMRAHWILNEEEKQREDGANVYGFHCGFLHLQHCCLISQIEFVLKLYRKLD